MLTAKRLSIAFASLALLSLSACGSEEPTPSDAAMQRISLKKLDKVPAGKAKPGEIEYSGSVSRDDWSNDDPRDTGMVEVVTDPAAQKGIALKTGQVFIVRDGMAEAISFKDLETKYADVRSKVSSPGDIVADSIKGWYDTGHNYHAEKMGGKDFGGVVVDPIDQKGVVIGQ